MAAESSQCITENELLSWVSGALPKERIHALDGHLDGCEHCQLLVGEAMQGSNSHVVPRREHTFAEAELVAGRYRITRFIARGGMGEVYEVYDLWLKHPVALKTLVATISDSPSALARLKTEVLTARQVSHPNVCRIFDLGFHDKKGRSPSDVERIAFFTMELLEGETLKAHIKRNGPLDAGEARAVALQVVTGLAHAHDTGVVHRDFKSDNVMLVPSNDGVRAVVTDFGLARSLWREASEPLTSSGHGPLGTLDYMSPEQVKGGAVTHCSDLFALGVVLFEMVTGQLPFEGDTPLGRALQRVHTSAPRPTKLVPNLDRSWERAILRCLTIDPSKRVQSAHELLPLLSGTEVPGHRMRRVPWGLGLVAVMLSVGLVAVLWAPRSPSLPRSPTTEVPSPRSPATEVPSPPPVANDALTIPSSSIPSAPAVLQPPAPEPPAPQSDRTRPAPVIVPARKQTTPPPRATTDASPPQKPIENNLLDPFQAPSSTSSRGK